jgi:hypothetical protein
MSQEQHPDAAQKAPLQVPPQASQLISTSADIHATDAPTFHTGHDTTPPTPTQPHTEDAKKPQDPIAARHPPEADAATKEECADLSTHPFQTVNIHSSCALCLHRRTARLQQLEEETSTVRFEDWRWKVRYLSPTPEEARYSAEWGNVGSAVGSWVKDLKGKRDEILGAFKDQVGDNGRRRDSKTDGMGLRIVGALSPSRKKGKRSGSAGSGVIGKRSGVTSSWSC